MIPPAGISDTNWQKFLNFTEALHDGDKDAALGDLLFCHKVLYAQTMKQNREEDDHK
jgi:hypothetical protein